jgi:hypothetical protein
MPRLIDLYLSEESIDAQRGAMRALINSIVRPNEADIDLMVRAWLDRLGGVGADAIGVTGVEVYVPLQTVEVGDGAVLGMSDDTASQVARDAIRARQPTRDDLRVVATDVLGATLVTALGI